MGHFIICLPENQRADVHFGKVRKLQFPLFSKNKEEKRGYIVRVTNSENGIEFHLFKSTNGKWSKDADGKAGLNENILFLIKDAIMEKENELNIN